MPISDTQLKQAAQALRHGDITEATRLTTETLLAARATLDPLQIAYALRHAANLRSKMAAQREATLLIDEAIAIYRERADTHALDLANALRVAALNHERAALAAWKEAKQLYHSVGVQAGVDGATHHIQQLADTLGGIS